MTISSPESPPKVSSVLDIKIRVVNCYIIVGDEITAAWLASRHVLRFTRTRHHICLQSLEIGRSENKIFP